MRNDKSASIRRCHAPASLTQNAQTAELVSEALAFADCDRETSPVPPIRIIAVAIRGPPRIPKAGRGKTVPAFAAGAYRNRIRDAPTTVSRPVRSISSTLCGRLRTNTMTPPRPEVSGRNKTTPACR